MRIILDTNVLLTSFSSSSANHWVWQALTGGRYTLYLTHDILLEYEEIINQHGGTLLANAVTDALLDLPNVVLIQRYYRWNLIFNDPDDNKFVDCAVAAQAQYLVSQDKHFSVLNEKEFPYIRVIGLTVFKEVLDM